MAVRVAARFFHVSDKPEDIKDFPNLLLESAKPEMASDRECDLGKGVLLRLERCKAVGGFLEGEFCRRQTDNIPPQASPDGLTPIEMQDGEGLGHLAAFRYHKPTRVMLLQTNRLSASPKRISLYAAAVSDGGLYTLKPVLREDAWTRFSGKEVRRVTLGFASPANLEALDQEGIPAAKGAKLLAEAYDGLEIDITISVGRQRKVFLSAEKVFSSVKQILSSNAHMKKVEVKTSIEDGGDEIDFLEEHMMGEKELDLPSKNTDEHFQIRNSFLKTVFSDNMGYINKHFGPK